MSIQATSDVWTDTENLPLHRTEATHLPVKLRPPLAKPFSSELEGTNPVVRLIILPRAPRIRALVLGVVTVNKVLHDGTTLEQVDRLAVREGVRQGRNTSIGVDLEEPGLLSSQT